MGLTNKKEEQLKKMPGIECTIGRSKDGRFVIHRTIITHVKPSAYYRAVMDGKEPEEQLQEIEV